MNKDVIYIEPEEDITDIISKIEGSKSKIVALVPPKKAGVFRSIVNIKLIAKTAAGLEKSVVLVTTDSSIIKLAAATKMPVTKDLKSAPKIPEPEDEVEDTEVVDVDDEAEEEPEEEEEEAKKKTEEKEEPKEEEEEGEEEEEEGDEEDEEEEEKKEEKKETKKPAKKEKKGLAKLADSNNPVLKWIGTHPKISVGIGIGFILFILIMIWALVIAPAVTITLRLETTTGNFSENITFTETLTDENISEGKFYIEEKKVESKTEVEFEATGKKNVGEKASGELTASYFFPINSDGGTVAIKSGTVFSNSSKNYTATADASIHWDGDVTSAAKDCENYGKSGWKDQGCKVSTKVKIAASEPGTAYNVAANTGGWSTSISGVSITGSTAIDGGTDKNVTVVQQSDIDAALKELNSEDLNSENKTENKDIDSIKAELLSKIEEGEFKIESSYKQTASDPVSSPEVGKEVEDGKKAKLTVTTTASIFVVDDTKLKEFIAEKAKLDKGYKIYEMKDPFVENFVKTDAGYIGKLKTSYVAGSTVTENDVVETAKGKGIGTAKRDISDNFDGIKSIDISTSVPWATSVPGNPEKITVIIKTDVDKKEE